MSIMKLVSAIGFFLPSGLTILIFRWAGHTIGRNVKLPMFSYLCARRIVLGNDVEIRPFTLIDVSVLELGANTIISFAAQVKGRKGLFCGDNCMIGTGVIIHCDEEVRLGYYSGLGPRTTVYTHGSFLPVTLGYPAHFERVTLGDFVWVCMDVKINPGTVIGSNCIINSGAVVTGHVPAGTLLQLAPHALLHLPLATMTHYGQKDPADHLETICRDFLERPSGLREIEHPFSTPSGHIFSFDTVKNQIRIQVPRTKREIVYDFNEFAVDPVSDPLNRQFQFFLRRRYGVTMRTRYPGQALRPLPLAGRCA